MYIIVCAYMYILYIFIYVYSICSTSVILPFRYIESYLTLLKVNIL